ncbi:MAG: iron-containing alcohol dehydrogenase, partial [Clostridiales bacterium]|nr:iron-containing alcohol dehydrogenase [Clostridiales bacterium]
MDRLEANRNYDCFCGNGIATEFVAGYLLEKNNLGLTDPAPFKVAIISDRQVSGYYYNEFENQFILRNIHPRLIACDAQEASKSLKTVSEIVADLRDQELGAQDWIIALGGGGVIDCASFAAAVYSGRCNLILVPTTLGSMAESTVAERAYLNSGKYKDAAFIKAEPTAVFADPKFLSTVPGKYKSNGYAPIIRL